MNCYAVNEADNGLVHRDYSQVYDPRRALTRRFFHSGFGGGGERSRSPKGASILAITLMWGARRNRSVVRPRLSPVKHSNVSIKQPLSPFILSTPSCKMARPIQTSVYTLSTLADNCPGTVTADNPRRCDAQMLKKLEMTRKRYRVFLNSLKSLLRQSNDFFCFFFYQIQIQKLMNCTQKLWIIIILSFLSIKYYKYISELSIGFAIIFH